MKIIQKRLLFAIIMAISCLAIMLVIRCTAKTEIRKKSIFDNESAFWQIYLDDLSLSELNDDGVPYAALQENGLDFINYWVQACNVIQGCYSFYYIKKDAEVLSSCEQIISCIQDTFYKYQKFPRPEYKAQELDYGWVSSMDAPSIMVASQMLYELTGEKTYHDFIMDLKEYVTESSQGGGYNLAIQNSVWPLEYAYEGSTDTNSLYVLNGSLVGYIGVKAVNQILGDHELQLYCQKVERTYCQKFSEFHYVNNSWTYYMKNPKTVIPIHYMIFEKKLFEGAYYLNNISQFLDEALYRENLLNQVLNVEFYQKEGAIEYYMLRACSPHYYQIDTYGTKLKIYDNTGKILFEDFAGISGASDREHFYKGAFLTGTIDLEDISELAYYEVYAVNNNREYLLFQDNINIQPTSEDDAGSLIESNISVKYDAIKGKEENQYYIQKSLSEKTEGDILFSFDSPLKSESVIGLEIENMSDSDITTGLILYDSTGKGTGRYYTPLTAGKNFILFDARGFAGSDSLTDIDSIYLRLYNNNLVSDNIEIQVGNRYLFNNNKEIIDYLKKSEYKINPQ